MAEASALRDGLKLAWERGWKRVGCEVDSVELLQVLQQRMNGNIFPIVVEIWNYLDRNWEISINRISRDYNAVADHIARIIARTVVQEFWVLETPSFELEVHLLRDVMSVV
ncbi:uncharacterized protein LOC130742565 [Lotus japonicus]|uniref:uncharacterized protein LOC130742565 n=1 Tax=Lotus japonicus TaxID=34305 RepID=UPI0025855761|nr:uncharacterized protein LOC130742565 [Lotus japonicus]